MANKGFPFEREICKILSLWWTQDEDPPREDVFWRTAGSGGRATNRHKKGKTTKNADGDICATDPDGQPLIDLIHIEVKRGYNRATVADLLDASEHAKEQQYVQWINKAVKACEVSKVPFWVIIHKRDRRETMITMEGRLAEILGIDDMWGLGGFVDTGEFHVVVTTLVSFLKAISASDIETLSRNKTRYL